MLLTSLKSGPRGREESCGVIGPVAHGETVTGVCVQEVKRKCVKRINKKSCHISARDNEGKYVCG